MDVRVIERDRITVNGLDPIVLYAIQTEVYPGAGWVEIARTNYPDSADFVQRAIEFYEQHRAGVPA